MAEDNDYIQATLDSIRRSQVSKFRVVLLRESNGKRFIPIWIGRFDATSIISAIECQRIPHPNFNCIIWLTWAIIWILGLRQFKHHPFNLSMNFKSRFLLANGTEIEQIAITGLVNDIYLAEVVLATTSGFSKSITLRPSDALILALRHNKPLYVLRKIFDEAGVIPEEE